jgi:O-methyltransferase
MARYFMSDLDTEGASLYLDLLKDCLTRTNFPDQSWNHDLVSTRPMDPAERADGRDWPTEAETMVGRARLDNLQHCVTEVIRQQIPGDLVETGVWRGGASILMRAVLQAYGDRDRSVWLADSFEGLPRPSPADFPPDTGDDHWTLAKYLAVPRYTVEGNFRRYGLLDDQVKFLPGWFRDTLPVAPIERIAVLRLDGDMYESTILALSTLYPKVAAGGFLIVDDYGALPNCRLAVEDFRSAHGITDPIVTVDWTGAYWRKGAVAGVAAGADPGA